MGSQTSKPVRSGRRPKLAKVRDKSFPTRATEEEIQTLDMVVHRMQILTKSTTFSRADAIFWMSEMFMPVLVGKLDRLRMKPHFVPYDEIKELKDKLHALYPALSLVDLLTDQEGL